jgi:hypothetical protein
MNTLEQIKSDIEDGTLTNPRVVYDRMLAAVESSGSICTEICEKRWLEKENRALKSRVAELEKR